VICIPTSVDTEHYHNRLKEHSQNGLVVGWTGSHSTEKYLDMLVPALQALEKEIDFSFIVISDRMKVLPLKNVIYCAWTETEEVSDLLKMDVGVMPLKNDEWSEGKCGFKLVQYLALGIPAVASPVGVNKIIIEHGINGFLCNDDDEWKQALIKLLTDRSLREAMGSKGKKKIEEQYSIRSQKKKFIDLFS
jgi:glycosyltransferase involved in cell wall biosynthesis